MDQLAQLIAESYSTSEATRAAIFRPHDQSLHTLRCAGYELLRNFQSKPGVSGMMTALWVQCIRDTTPYPIHGVAGALFIDNEQVFEAAEKAQRVKEAHDARNLTSGGYYWVSFGDYIADASLCRTAHSTGSPRLLRREFLPHLAPRLAWSRRLRTSFPQLEFASSQSTC